MEPLTEAICSLISQNEMKITTDSPTAGELPPDNNPMSLAQASKDSTDSTLKSELQLNPENKQKNPDTTCKQSQGEAFLLWWETRLKKAQECALKTMSSDNWLVLELVPGVNGYKDNFYRKEA